MNRHATAGRTTCGYSARSAALRGLKVKARALVAAAGLCLAASSCFATAPGFPGFADTNDISAWTVSTVVGGTDGDLSSFSTADFEPAVAISGRPGWISNVSSGTNGGIDDWTFFVFRETFTLTAVQAASADLQFTWAADDSGQGFADRGTWTPKYSLNSGTLVAGSWPGGESYDLGSPTDITSGFVAGANTLDFYVEGNGVTDGMSLALPAVPEPDSIVLMLVGLGVLGVVTHRSRQNTH